MKYLSRQQLKEIDRRAIEEFGIPALILMENAGRAVADEAIKLYRKNRSPMAAIVCGKGNNGGDGLVVARHLHNHGFRVAVLYLDAVDNKAGKSIEVLTNLEIIKKLNIQIIELAWMLNNSLKENKKLLDKTYSLLGKSGVIIDAIFGIGLERPIEGHLKNFIERINSLSVPKIAVDIPSGLDADTGLPLGAAVKAKTTISLVAMKKGFKNPESRKFTGKIKVADISIPCRII